MFLTAKEFSYYKNFLSLDKEVKDGINFLINSIKEDIDNGNYGKASLDFSNSVVYSQQTLGIRPYDSYLADIIFNIKKFLESLGYKCTIKNKNLKVRI